MVTESFKRAYIGILQENLEEGLGNKLKAGLVGAAIVGSMGASYLKFKDIGEEKSHLSNISTVSKKLSSSDTDTLKHHLKSIGASDEEATKGATIAKSNEDSIHPTAKYIAAAMTMDGGKLKIPRASGNSLEDQARSVSSYLHNNTYVSKEGNLHNVSELEDSEDTINPLPYILAAHLAGKFGQSYTNTSGYSGVSTNISPRPSKAMPSKPSSGKK